MKLLFCSRANILSINGFLAETGASLGLEDSTYTNKNFYDTKGTHVPYGLKYTQCYHIQLSHLCGKLSMPNDEISL